MRVDLRDRAFHVAILFSVKGGFGKTCPEPSQKRPFLRQMRQAPQSGTWTRPQLVSTINVSQPALANVSDTLRGQCRTCSATPVCPQSTNTPTCNSTRSKPPVAIGSSPTLRAAPSTSALSWQRSSTSCGPGRHRCCQLVDQATRQSRVRIHVAVLHDLLVLEAGSPYKSLGAISVQTGPVNELGGCLCCRVDIAVLHDLLVLVGADHAPIEFQLGAF